VRVSLLCANAVAAVVLATTIGSAGMADGGCVHGRYERVVPLLRLTEKATLAAQDFALEARFEIGRIAPAASRR
jgi:hypothetical protein